MRGRIWVVAALMAGAAIAAKAEMAKPMSVDDVILDLAVLKGKVISVIGYTTCAGQNGSMCMLYDDPTNFTKNIFFDASKMGRDDRSRIISCSILTACRVTLTGVVVNQLLKTLDITGMDWGEGMSNRPQREETYMISAPKGAISVKDFILDGAQMRGKAVTVHGAAQCNGTSCWLTEAGWTSQQVVSFDATQLSRDNRKKLLECSQAFSAGCEAEVTGAASEGGRLTSVSIIWR